MNSGVRSIDRAAREIHTGDGEAVRYDKLLIATGAQPRRLTRPGSDLANIFYLRSRRDAELLRPILTCGGRVVIIGGGYVGLEVAAVARQAGLEVTLLEAADRVLARVASRPVSAFYQDMHRGAGVDLRLGAALTGFAGIDGHVAGAELTTGEVISCQAVLIGIGASPAVELAIEAELETGDGIRVDVHARTVDDNIWAAGDCTNFPSPRYQRRMRLESVPNAVEQAKIAAANMAGGDQVHDALPWFWSDQYDVKLQSVGLSEGHDEFVVRGDPGMQKFSVWYLKKNRLLAVDAINDAASFASSKKYILEQSSIDLTKVADVRCDLKSLAD